jgi:hypothetical protein
VFCNDKTVVFKVAFFILRLLVALGAIAVLAGTFLVFLVTNFLVFIGSLLKTIAAVVTTFATAFQKSPDAPGPTVVLSPLMAGLAITFLGIFASVFMPGQKIFLHIVAVLAILAAAWDIWRSATTPSHPLLFLPVILLWFVYYVVCLRRA